MLRAARVLTSILALAAPLALAQTSGPVAYIYVSSDYSGLTNRVVGYAASADGRLTQISGSPWADNLSYLATSGSYLFGSTNIPGDDGKNIFSYKVESNGALKYIGATNIHKGSADNDCNTALNLLLDHTGSYLYTYVENANCDSEFKYESFAVNKSTGLLGYLGVTLPSAFTVGHPLTMLADNTFAYASGDGAEDAELCGYKRDSNGKLVDLKSYGGSPVCNTAWPGTQGQPSGASGYAGLVAADPTNHLALNMEYFDENGSVSNRIATIAIDTANGSQSTASTYANMPESDVEYATSMAMAPGGKLLALGGSNGLQIFNFNPSGQASVNTGLISRADITALYWDNSGHLYAISGADNALHVFTVTATGAEEAPGSPYSIPHPVGLTGHSLTTGSGASAPQYEASFTRMNNAATGSGQISVDAAGQVTLQLAGAPAGASYTVAFCPAFWFYQGPASCFNVGAVATDSAGGANVSMQFPKSGQWAGDFELNSGSTQEYLTTYTPVYRAQMEPESTLNGGQLSQSGEDQLPLASGAVTYAGGSFQFTLTGTLPGTTFVAIENEDELGSSGSYYLLNDFTSANGNASFSEPPSGAGGDLLEIEQTFYTDQSEQGFFGGFSVP